MKLFLDTANIKEIGQAVEWGVIEGVTTNPSLASREEENFLDILPKICRLVEGPVSAEVISDEWKGMVKEARQLAAVADNVVIKIPVTWEGLQAVKILAGEGIKTNVTLVFSVNQALLAARAGASYVSPFLGRLDDIGESGISLLKDMVSVFERHQIATRIIAASIRHPEHVTQAALAGAPVATIPYQVLRKMVAHPLTDQGLEKFMTDWQKSSVNANL